MKKTLFFKHLFWVPLALCAFLVACDSLVIDQVPDMPTELPTIIDGTPHTVTLFKDGEALEELSDVFFDFGTPENAAFFPVRQSHTLLGKAIDNPLSPNNCFRSISKEQYVRLAKAYHAAYGGTLLSALDEDNDTVDEQVDKLRPIFAQLFSFIIQSKIDASLLAAVNENILASNNSTKLGVFEFAQPGTKAGSLTNESLKELEWECMNNSTPVQVTKVTPGVVIHAIAVATTVIKTGLKIILKLVEATKPKVDLHSSFVAYLGEDDNPVNYPTSGHVSQSPKYSFQHKFWGVVYARASFKVFVDYHGAHKGYDTYFIPNIAFLVEDIKCVGGQHVEGSATFCGNGDPTIQAIPNSTMKTIVVPMNIQLDYGDCCCYNYHANVKSNIFGDSGYHAL